MLARADKIFATNGIATIATIAIVAIATATATTTLLIPFVILISPVNSDSDLSYACQ